MNVRPVPIVAPFPIVVALISRNPVGGSPDVKIMPLDASRQICRLEERSFTREEYDQMRLPLGAITSRQMVVLFRPVVRG